MFEQSILIDHPANKSWSVFISLSAQVLFVALGIAVPLFLNSGLPQVRWTTIISAPPPPAPAPAQSVPTRRGAAMPAAKSPVFIAPQRIPRSIASIVDDQPATAIVPPPPAGVPFSVGGSGGISTLMDNLMPKVSPPPPPAARKPDNSAAPVLQGGRVQAAKLIKQVIPQYPALARQARISGTVRLQGLIAKDGTIKDLQLISGHPLLVQAALQAVRQWVYRPTTLNGEVVEVAAPIDVVFTLNQ